MTVIIAQQDSFDVLNGLLSHQDQHIIRKQAEHCLQFRIWCEFCLCMLLRCWQATSSILTDAPAATYEEFIFSLLILAIEAS